MHALLEECVSNVPENIDVHIGYKSICLNMTSVSWSFWCCVLDFHMSTQVTGQHIGLHSWSCDTVQRTADQTTRTTMHLVFTSILHLCLYSQLHMVYY